MAKLDDVTHQIELPETLENIKKNRTVLRRLALIMQPNCIQLDNMTG